MPKRIDVTRLSPQRRGFLIGYRRAKAKARAELREMAADFDAELLDLQHEFHAIAVELHRERVDRAIDEARIERAAMSPETLLH